MQFGISNGGGYRALYADYNYSTGFHKESLFDSLYSKLTIQCIIIRHWKFQMKQSTSDGENCQQQLIYDNSVLWSESLRCPEPVTYPLNIYFTGTDSRVVSGEVRNFRFSSIESN